MTNRRTQRLTIGIDFGTTYSGVAFSSLEEGSSETHLIKDWGAGPSSDKVPSVIRYNVSDHVRGVLGYKWGFQVKHHERRQEWFKLALDPMTYVADDCVDFGKLYSNELADPPDYNRDAMTLVTDYLTALRKHVEKEIPKQIGTLSGIRTQWVITTPAIWSDRARDDTLRCAERARISGGEKITITSEPEAAAAYTLKSLPVNSFQLGDNIVICDAGGGTVDLITYRLTSVSPSLEVEESAIPGGGKCGGVFVNRIFEKMILQRLGKNSGLTENAKYQASPGRIRGV
ncbi:MAG: hypothetical protein M1839_003086, partial [Geoglossum umbratile]